MKLFTFFFCFFMLSALNNVFGQKIHETSFALGINITSSPVQHNHWNENPSPTYLTFNATKSWYNNDHRFSIRKEAGLNLQYSNINLDSGGLGGHNCLISAICGQKVNFQTFMPPIIPVFHFLSGSGKGMVNNHLKNDYSDFS